jgi:protein SCO1/2
MRIKISSFSMVFVALFLLIILGFPIIIFTGDKQGKVELKEKVQLPFEVKSNTKVVLLYFGYVGCRTICSPSLAEIAAIYNELNNTKNVAFYFINISHEGVGAKEFAEYFHKEFIGLQLSQKETSNLMGALRAYSSDALVPGGEIYHTGYLYVITQKKQQDFELRTMYYTRPFDIKSVVLDIEKELK